MTYNVFGGTLNLAQTMQSITYILLAQQIAACHSLSLRYQ